MDQRMSDALTPSSDHYLRPLLVPRSVAIVGASDRLGVLGTMIRQIIADNGYAGRVYLVNPNRRRVGDERCYDTLEDIGAPVDLAVVTTRAPKVARILEQAGRAGTRAALVMSGGFAETGEQGARLQREIVDIARRGGVRLLGPNCMGLLRARIRLNTSYATRPAKPGGLALVSQSGAVCAALLDFAASVDVGLSTALSLGAAADVDFGEILDFLITDVETDAILLYVEGIQDARRFLSSLRAAARTKPVIVLKSGRHLAGSRAATSHSGAMVGNDDVFAAALRRSGTVRVRTYTQFFAAARILGAGRIPRGNRLAIVTNGGGPGVLAADAAADNDVALARLSEETLQRIAKASAWPWSRGNPVDISGDAPSAQYIAALEAVLNDPEVDAVLALYAPQRATTPAQAANALISAARGTTKPVLAAWLGSVQKGEGQAALESAGIPNFYTPENAVDAFSYLAAYRTNQQLLLEVPSPLPPISAPDYDAAESLRQRLIAEGRAVMTEEESRRLVRAFGVPVADTAVATSEEQAVEAARAVGFPVALKILSPDIPHKTDAGGVMLHLRTGRSVATAYRQMVSDVRRRRPDARIDGVLVQQMIVLQHAREVLVGIATDPTFGPVVTFGAGGIEAEAVADIAMMLPPLNRSLALDLIGRPRISRLLAPFRDFPQADVESLAQMLLQVSTLACALPWVRELDLNPVLVDADQAIAVDAHVAIDPTREAKPVRYRHMAIHPYPSQLESTVTTRDGAVLRVRPIRPEDAMMEREFVARLSDQTRYLRFQHHLHQLTPQMLARFTQIDYDREMALVALCRDPVGEHMVCIARYVPNPNRISAEFAIVVADDWQGRGIGHVMMTRLLDAAREVGYRYIEGSVLSMNAGMLRLMVSLGFRVERDDQDPGAVRVVRDLA